jgi:hypothetical protein
VLGVNISWIVRIAQRKMWRLWMMSLRGGGKMKERLGNGQVKRKGNGGIGVKSSFRQFWSR